MYQVPRAELAIMERGLQSPEGLDYFCGYFYNKGEGKHFQFDRNFDSIYRWQKKLIFASQTLIVGVMGIGSGKTLGVGMGAFTWCMSTSDFKFMNGANWAYQSKLMKELIEGQILDTPAERFIDNIVDTPYPKITLRFKIGSSTYVSSMEFMSMDGQAAKIFSWRGDWINLDEAALIDKLDIALMNLSTRLTGRTARGREFLGRMSLMSNPWDNDSSTHLYYFYDLAIENPSECLSISIPTRANKNVTDRQINNTMMFIRSKEEQDRMLEGLRPEGSGPYFSKPRVNACADGYISEWVAQSYSKGIPGFQVVNAPTVGAVEYQFPARSESCFLVGDPGTGSFPARNAPVLAVIDASNLPQSPAIVCAFWWGNGNKHIQPFIDKLYELKERYHPTFIGVDSTGPQSGMVQVLNLSQFWNGVPMTQLYQQTPITGLDFSVGRKHQMLLALRTMVELGQIKWADSAKGIKMQMFHYDPSMDRGGEPKIAQDIVATLAMGAFVVRAYLGLEDRAENAGWEQDQEVLAGIARNLRRAPEAGNYRR